jgi:hypothetical protein
MKYKPVFDKIQTPSFEEGEIQQSNKPKVLFAAIYAPVNTGGSIFSSDFMVRGFEQAGYEVMVMDWQKIKFNEAVEGLRDRLLIKAKIEQPEFIFLHIQNKDVIDIETAKALNKIAPVVMYNFDARQPNEMQWSYELSEYITLNIFSSQEDVLRCKQKGFTNVCCISSSADYDNYKPIKVTAQHLKDYPHEIVFIGNKFDKSNMKFDKAAERTEMVEFLTKEYGDRFKAWGMGYSKMVNQQEEQIIYNCAKIAVTQNNFLRTSYCSDRGYRAMGCGILTIHQYFPEINKFFNSQVCSTWLNFDMLKEQIDKYLEDEILRYAKGKAGAAFVRERHSWYNRVLEIQELLKIHK